MTGLSVDLRQRIDRWLWNARIVRTRSSAAALAASGHVRINGARIDAASRMVRAGDVLTIALDHTVRVLRVLDFVERRAGAEAARALYEDITEQHSDAPVQSSTLPRRAPGTGRPTKRDRRRFDRLREIAS